MTNDYQDNAFLSALAAVLLPGTATWPSGPAAGVDDALREGGARDQVLVRAIEEAARSLPGDFGTLSPEERAAAMRLFERDRSADFAIILQAAYAAYYTAAPVLEAVERNSGFPARAPQPDGYAITQSDWTVFLPAQKR